MATSSLLKTGLLRAFPIAVVILTASTDGVPAAAHPVPHSHPSAATALAAAAPATRITIPYTTHDGHRRNAYLLLPHGYGPDHDPAIPLVISPHGRAVDGLINTRRWGNLPTVGNFAVINPDGYGRRLPLHSWGYS